MNKSLCLFTMALSLTGCATIDRSGYSRADVAAIPEEKCNVKVFPTYHEAIKNGPIEELCTVYGNSSMSFVHTVEVAVNRAKPRVCECGATNAYIKSSKPMVWSVAEVELIAFRFAKRAIDDSSPTTNQQRYAPPVAYAPPPASPSVQPMYAGSTNSASTTKAVADRDNEMTKVVNFLAENRFPLVGEPIRFKQKENLTFYEVKGSGGRLTQVVCDSGSGVCRFRGTYD